MRLGGLKPIIATPIRLPLTRLLPSVHVRQQSANKVLSRQMVVSESMIARSANHDNYGASPDSERVRTWVATDVGAYEK